MPYSEAHCFLFAYIYIVGTVHILKQKHAVFLAGQPWVISPEILAQLDCHLHTQKKNHTLSTSQQHQQRETQIYITYVNLKSGIATVF